MLRVNTKNQSNSVALISGGKNDKKNIVFDTKPNAKGTKEIILSDGKLVPLPTKKKRDVLYISAPSGAGKTYWLSNYIKQYKKMFKHNEIYFISSIGYDKVIDDIKGIIRLNIDEDFIEDGDLTIEDFTDSLVIFDDCDTIQNKQVKNYIERLRDYLLEQGRHSNTYMLMTHHLLSNYKATRIMLNECTGMVLFPKVNGSKLKLFLETYAGIESDGFKKIKGLPSRWIYIVKSYPHYLVYEKGCYILE